MNRWQWWYVSFGGGTPATDCTELVRGRVTPSGALLYVEVEDGLLPRDCMPARYRDEPGLQRLTRKEVEHYWGREEVEHHLRYKRNDAVSEAAWKRLWRLTCSE